MKVDDMRWYTNHAIQSKTIAVATQYKFCEDKVFTKNKAALNNDY